MLTKEQINKNKEEFISLIKQIDRKSEGADVEGLIKFLETRTDFFNAPASTKYHCCYEGGLCEHSLHVYKKLVKLIDEHSPKKYDNETLIICGLLHDISKINFYERYFRNEKVYSADGSKYDDLGNYDWVSVPYYRVKEAKDRAVGFNHEEMSTFLIQRFIPLSYEEAVAVSNHHGGLGNSVQNLDLNDIYKKYPLTLLLHTADMFSCYIDEKEY